MTEPADSDFRLGQDYVPFDPRPFGAHAKLLSLVPDGVKVLDVGCSTGYLAEQLVARGCSVTGIELDQRAARRAERFCQQVIVGDLEQTDLPPETADFDIVLCGDILEHLRNPARALAKLRPVLRPQGRLVLSTPNIANWAIRVSLAAGRFDYGERGILDRTHTHLFTRKALLQCLASAGFEPVTVDYTVPLPHTLRTDARERFAHRVAAVRPTLFAYQWVTSARRLA
jgi:2-polyprenyl-3-methyl-5-hydroxy-6-metoxy-1,4-benzoquinol methylase